MYRIGIIGTENSHAAGFAKYFNKTAAGRAKVVGVMGNAENDRAIVEEYGAEFIAESPSDFFGKVDAMMVTSRAGSLHKAAIEPFVKAGMPVFIDKPFTSDPEEAAALIDEIKKYSAPVMGGSGCKFVKSVRDIKAKVKEWRENDELIQAAINFNVMLDSPYDGIYFYAAHLVEMCLEIFGNSPKKVRAERLNGSLIATVYYDDMLVGLHFTATAPESTCVLYGKDGNYIRNVDISDMIERESEAFISLIEKGEQPYSVDYYYLTIAFIDAIRKSYESGKTIEIEGRLK